MLYSLGMDPTFASTAVDESTGRMRVKDVREQTGARAVRSLAVSVLAVVVLAVPAAVLADGRVALVVGNSTCAHIGRLPNAENDAVDVSAALRRLGFEVTTELEADRVEMTAALRAFTRIDGVTYLVPVDARLERDVDLRYEAVTLDDLLVATAGASLRLVILDACRRVKVTSSAMLAGHCGRRRPLAS